MWQFVFLGLRHNAGNHQLLQKFVRNHETTKGRKDDTNIHLLNGEDRQNGAFSNILAAALLLAQ